MRPRAIWLMLAAIAFGAMLGGFLSVGPPSRSNAADSCASLTDHTAFCSCIGCDAIKGTPP